MSDSADTNAEIWKSDEVVKEWVAQASERDRQRIAHWQILAELLPYEETDSFTFLDLGAGTGAATRTLLELYPNSEAILAEYSPQMIEEGERALAVSYGGRFRYVEFDMLAGKWPAAIPSGLDAVVTSLCIHHMPDDRKQGLFGEIFERLAPGSWYLNYDPVTSEDPIVEATWQHTNDRGHPHAERREHRTELEHARWENHIRYMIPLDRQLDYFRAVGFEGVDVYWKHLENVVYGGRRPS